VSNSSDSATRRCRPRVRRPPAVSRRRARTRTSASRSICDALAEESCRNLCLYYLKRFGVILHHNVDKMLLCGGAARPSFGGGEVTEPMELYLAGRATAEHNEERVPVAEIAVEACRAWLRTHLPALDLERDVRFIPKFRPGSGALRNLFSKGKSVALANDTSCGAGFAPLTRFEQAVLEVERTLNDAAVKRIHPAIGQDIKVMGVRACYRAFHQPRV
jgi:S-adenosylmethionine synthetase